MEKINPKEFKDFVMNLLDSNFEDIDQDKTDFVGSFGKYLTLKQLKKEINKDYGNVIWIFMEVFDWGLKSGESLTVNYQIDFDSKLSSYNRIYLIEDKYYGLSVEHTPEYKLQINEAYPKYKQVMYF